MSKTPRRFCFRIHDLLTLHALAADPDIRIRVKWRGDSGASFYHGVCAIECSAQIERWVTERGMAVHGVRRASEKWAHWRASCPHCRGSINVPGRKPEQLTWDLALP